MPGNQPSFVVVVGELKQSAAQLLDGIEGVDLLALAEQGAEFIRDRGVGGMTNRLAVPFLLRCWARSGLPSASVRAVPMSRSKAAKRSTISKGLQSLILDPVRRRR